MRKFRIVVEGRPYEVEVEEIGADSTPSASTVAVAPAVIAAPAAKPVVNTANGTQLKSPMPGNVLGLKVASGASVKKGQTILVLEAMKMENDIAANADGIVTFSVAKGSTVNTGDILAVIA